MLSVLKQSVILLSQQCNQQVLKFSCKLKAISTYWKDFFFWMHFIWLSNENIDLHSYSQWLNYLELKTADAKDALNNRNATFYYLI